MLNKYPDLALLILRLFFGGLMLARHGWPKLMKLVNGDMGFADPFGLGSTFTLIVAVLAEAICAVLITIGLFTRWATLPLMITMLTAAFVIHIDDAFNKMEFPLLYFAAYLALFLSGPGEYSVDARRSKGMV